MLLNKEPKFNFIIRIKELSMAGEGQFFKDVYEVSLNNNMSIFFVPPHEHRPDQLNIPYELRKTSDNQESAIKEIIASSEYCVIPYDKLAGQVFRYSEEVDNEGKKLIPGSAMDSIKIVRVIIYIKRSQWNVYRKEFEEYFEQDLISASELKNKGYVSLLQNLINSKYIQEKDLKGIGR